MNSEDLITITKDCNQNMQFISRQRVGKENKAQQRGEENCQENVQRTSSHDPGIKQNCPLMV